MRAILGAALALALTVSAASANGLGTGLNQSYAPYLGQLPPPEQNWFKSAFKIYKSAFIEPDGRVFDPQNGGITHSESQGYGMLLALLGGDRATFDDIWSFARHKLQRADKLFAWKWVPGQGVTDRNNATDGDILIATALALGGMRWKEPDYIAQAEAIATAVGRTLIIEYGGYTVLLPGEWAAPSRYEPKATLNLSYYIPLTLPVMEALAPRYAWEAVMRDGQRILDDLIHPPSDWSTINAHGEPVPASGFPRRFSYDAVRIPLYLLQYGTTNEVVTSFLLETWKDDDHGDQFTFDVYSFARLEKFWGTAYDFIHELLHCAEFGEPVAYQAMEMKMDNYFATSLHLMAIAAMYANYPECFPRQHAAGQKR